MTSPLETIEAAAMKLTAQERVDLADKLWLSAHSHEAVEQAWSDEIQRRMHQVDSGEVVCRTWPEVMANLKAIAQG